MEVELGSAKLLRSNYNMLFNALHPKHGFVWTDGNCIFLMPLSIGAGILSCDLPVLLAEYEQVDSVHWCKVVTDCFLAIVNGRGVSVWQIEGHVPDVKAYQIRKIDISPIQQGCLWNPRRNVLCILTAEQAQIFSFGKSSSAHSYKLQSSTGNITCGTWTDDGQKLIYACGTQLMIHSWKWADNDLEPCATISWRIPRVDGRVRAMVSGGDDIIICASELPLELIVLAQQDLFEVPDNLCLEVNSEDRMHSISQGTTHNDHASDEKETVISRKQPLPGSSLLHLKRKQFSIKDASQLFVISMIETEPHLICSGNLYGVLTPDLLTYQSSTRYIAVGNSSHNGLQIFKWEGPTLIKARHLFLQDKEKPKGVMFMQGTANPKQLLIVVGKKNELDNVFLPSSQYTNYDLDLRVMEVNEDNYDATDQSELLNVLKLPGGQVLNNKTVNMMNGSGSTNSLIQVMKEEDTISMSPQQSQNIGAIRVGLNEKISQDSVQDLSSWSSFSTPDVRRCSRESVGPSGDHQTLLGDIFNAQGNFEEAVTKMPHSKDVDLLAGISLSKDFEQHISFQDFDQNSKDSQYATSTHKENLSTEKEEVKGPLFKKLNRFERLQSCVEEILKVLKEMRTSHGLPLTSYPKMECAQTVNVVLSQSNRTQIKKLFLLDAGRIKLSAIKQHFMLITVEVLLGEEWCAVDCDVDGYIPLRFQVNSIVVIRGQSQESRDK